MKNTKAKQTTRQVIALISLTAMSVPACADSVHDTCSRYLQHAEVENNIGIQSMTLGKQKPPEVLHAPAAIAPEAVSAPAMADIAPPRVAPVAPSSAPKELSKRSNSYQKISPPGPVFVKPVPANTERYGHKEQNPVHSAAQTPISTFSIDVDTGSYANVRRFLMQENRLPPADAVRIEELINYFDYGYAPPAEGQPFAVHTEVVDSPFKSEAKLLRIGIQAKEMSKEALPPANLVFLVDVSGSMMSRDKLPMVKYTLCTLAHQTRAQDRVSLITYADGNKVVLPPTPGDQRKTILDALSGLQPGGSTAGEEAIQQAYREAKEAMIPNGINRILLATDGDFNVGITDFNTLKSMVAEKRRSGISLTTLGFGTGNYNEHMMEQLADAGDGNYSYIDSPEEAKKVLNRQLSSTLATVAQDVKIQVEFNPKTVKEYRLVGYENRMLAQEDFNNDQVDAGDIGAGHNVTALYEIIPAGAKGWLTESRYQAAPAASSEKDSNEYAFINLRYKLPVQSTSTLINQPVPVKSQPLEKGSNATQQAVAVAAYGDLLKGGKYSGPVTWESTLQLAKTAESPDPYGLRHQFVELIKKAKSLSSQSKQ